MPHDGDGDQERRPEAQLGRARQAAARCRACDLWSHATQTVFGEGPVPAPLMLVGEQPGDREDRAGQPFVGPAGRVLDEVLTEAGIDRDAVYVTNVVKHFKWQPRGSRRIHETPNRMEITACRPWLDEELANVQPEVLVALGATAARGLIDPSFRLTQHHGEEVAGTGLAPHVLASAHPSSILRIPDREAAHQARQQLVADLRVAARLLAAV